MRAVLYIGHGSRVKEGIDEAIDFIEKSKRLVNTSIQEICFLELAKPDMLSGISKCVERGATKIAIIPILLLTAIHAKEDIPNEIKKAKEKYPNIEFTYGNALGIHAKMIDSLYDRITEQDIAIKNEAEVLIIGRGSSDPEIKRDLNTIAEMLQKTYKLPTVNVCFLYGAEPHLDEALKKLKYGKQEQVFIIPYLLFSGLLMNEIAEKVKYLQDLGKEIILCKSLGYHSNIREILLERVNELLENEGGKYFI